VLLRSAPDDLGRVGRSRVSPCWGDSLRSPLNAISLGPVDDGPIEIGQRKGNRSTPGSQDNQVLELRVEGMEGQAGAQADRQLCLTLD
jgi:hypothetical protein